MNRIFTLLLAASCLTAVGQVGSQNCSGWGGPGISVTSEHGNSILVGEQVDFLMLDNNTPMMTCGSSFFTNPSSVTVISTSCVANQYISQSIVFNELGTFQILGQNGDGIGMTYCSLTITVADLEGCTSPDFLEFNPQATIDDGSCSTPVVFGCTDLEACNFDEAASVDDDSCTYSGCIDSSACNFQEDAACDDGSCDYGCCPGPGCCSLGQYWDWEVGKCFDINPADINLDGCVQLNDLLDLLSAYGLCNGDGQVVGEETVAGVFASACGNQTVVNIPVHAKYVISQGGQAPEYHRLMSYNAVVGDVKYVSWCVSYTNSYMNGAVYYQALDSSQTWQTIGFCVRQNNGSIDCSEEALYHGGNTPGTAAPRHFKFEFTESGWIAVENDILLID